MDKNKIYDLLLHGSDIWFYDKYGNARKARYSSKTLFVYDHSNKVIYESNQYDENTLFKFAGKITKHLLGI
jgi:hypothetical protein